MKLDEADQIWGGRRVEHWLAYAAGADRLFPDALDPLRDLDRFLLAEGEDGPEGDVTGVPHELFERWKQVVDDPPAVRESGGVRYADRQVAWGAARSGPRVVWRRSAGRWAPAVSGADRVAPVVAHGPARLWHAARRGVALVLRRPFMDRDRVMVFAFLVLPLLAPAEGSDEPEVPEWARHLTFALLPPRAQAFLLALDQAERRGEDVAFDAVTAAAQGAKAQAGFGRKLVASVVDRVLAAGPGGWRAAWRGVVEGDLRVPLEVRLNEAGSTGRAYKDYRPKVGEDPYEVDDGRASAVRQAADAVWLRWTEPPGLDEAWADVLGG